MGALLMGMITKWNEPDVYRIQLAVCSKGCSDDPGGILLPVVQSDFIQGSKTEKISGNIVLRRFISADL